MIAQALIAAMSAATAIQDMPLTVCVTTNEKTDSYAEQIAGSHERLARDFLALKVSMSDVLYLVPRSDELMLFPQFITSILPPNDGPMRVPEGGLVRKLSELEPANQVLIQRLFTNWPELRGFWPSDAEFGVCPTARFRLEGLGKKATVAMSVVKPEPWAFRVPSTPHRALEPLNPGDLTRSSGEKILFSRQLANRDDAARISEEARRLYWENFERQKAQMESAATAWISAYKPHSPFLSEQIKPGRQFPQGDPRREDIAAYFGANPSYFGFSSIDEITSFLNEAKVYESRFDITITVRYLGANGRVQTGNWSFPIPGTMMR